MTMFVVKSIYIQIIGQFINLSNETNINIKLFFCFHIVVFHLFQINISKLSFF